MSQRKKAVTFAIYPANLTPPPPKKKKKTKTKTKTKTKNKNKTKTKNKTKQQSHKIYQNSNSTSCHQTERNIQMHVQSCCLAHKTNCFWTFQPAYYCFRPRGCLHVFIERLRITFTSNGKREFVPRDQVSSLLVVYC